MSGALSKQPRAEQWADKICTQLGKSVESIIDVGRLLVKAKADLDHGEWGRLFEDKLVPFSQNTANQLMLIAKHPVVSNSAYVQSLPPSWGTLYELTKVPDQALDNAFRDGLITPSMERREVKALLPVKPATVAGEIVDDEITAEIKRLLQEGVTARAIASTLHISQNRVTILKRAMGLCKGPDRSRIATAQRRDQMRTMAAEGYTTRQIADAVSQTVDGCRNTLRAEAIDVPADRVVGKARNHDANRILEQIVMDAEHLTADQNLIVFDELDQERLGGWIDSLVMSRRALDAFIRRLAKEHTKHEVA